MFPLLKRVLPDEWVLPEPGTLEDRALGAYMGLAVGDALGATVEFMLPQEIVSQYGCHDKIRGGGWLQLKSGHVTDDTTMALALGECLVKGVPLNALLFAEAFDRWLRSKPVDVGNTVRRGIVNFRLTSNPEAPENDLDAGNGACMRLAPLAIVSRNWSLDVTRKVPYPMRQYTASSI
jgi:ADP-ribosyl-[dinitrogen reductase] hydrolase